MQGLGRRVKIDNCFPLTLVHYNPFRITEDKENFEHDLANNNDDDEGPTDMDEEWDIVLNELQRQDPRSFGNSQSSKAYRFRAMYEQRLLLGDCWGENEDRDRQESLSQRVCELERKRLSLLKAICKSIRDIWRGSGFEKTINARTDTGAYVSVETEGVYARCRDVPTT